MPKGGKTRGRATGPADREHERLMLLDRLEELREDMEELGITSRADLEARIAALHAEFDAAEADPLPEPR